MICSAGKVYCTRQQEAISKILLVLLDLSWFLTHPCDAAFMKFCLVAEVAGGRESKKNLRMQPISIMKIEYKIRPLVIAHTPFIASRRGDYRQCLCFRYRNVTVHSPIQKLDKREKERGEPSASPGLCK